MSVTVDHLRSPAPSRTGISPLALLHAERSGADAAPPSFTDANPEHELGGPDGRSIPTLLLDGGLRPQADVTPASAPEFRRRSEIDGGHTRSGDREAIDNRSRLRPDVAGRFDYVSFEDELLSNKTGWARRLVQGTIVLALAAAAGSLLLVLPERGDPDAATANPGGRIETEAKPVATAEMLEASGRPEVEGSLQLLASTGRLSKAKAARTPSIGTPREGGDGFATVVAEGVGNIDPQVVDSPTTTVWSEPELGPPSGWVDAGSGFMVPDLLLRIRFCESTNNYRAANPASTARGAYQFLNKSWDWYGHAARTGVAQAHLATPAQQDEAGLLTLQSQGTGPWTASRSCWADENIDPRYATAKPRPVGTTTTSTAAGSTTNTTGPSTTATTDPTSTETTAASSSTTADPSSTTSGPTSSTQPSSTTASTATTVTTTAG